MRAPTMMLFSFVIGTVILVFTADKLQQMMGGGQIVAKTEHPAEPGFSAQARELAATAWQNATNLYYNLVGQPNRTETLVISEDTVDQVWVWHDTTGSQRFSRTAPPANVEARQILYPRNMPLPDEKQGPAPQRDTAASSSDTVTAEGPGEHLPAILIDEQGESRFLEGLNNFRQLQGQGANQIAN